MVTIRSRLLITSGLALLMAGILWAGSSCGGQTTTTTVAVATTTTTVAQTTTMAQPTTTTSTIPTTTTTTERTWESLISKDKTIEVVRNTPVNEWNVFEWWVTWAGEDSADEPTLRPPMNVPDQLALDFLFLHGSMGWKIRYIGPSNRAEDPNRLEGNELNACLVDVTGRQSLGQEFLTFRMFGVPGAWGNEQGQLTGWELLVMEFKDIVLIPGSRDFYAHGVDPLNPESDMYVRIVRDKSSKYEQTMLLCLDIGEPYGFDYGLPADPRQISDPRANSEVWKNRERHYAGNLSEEALAKFFIPGDTLAFYNQFTSRGATVVDKNGQQPAYFAGVFRYAGADKIQALFK